MKQVSHFCYGDGSHSDNCECICIPCRSRRVLLKTEEYRKIIAEKVNEDYDKLLKEILLSKPYLKNKNGR